jgi:hypothetical protein
MFYHYTKPPTIPEDLAREVLKTLFICVPLYLFIAMYSYSNIQVFFDQEVPHIDPNYVFPLYDHHITDIFSFEAANLSPASSLIPFLIYYLYKAVMIVLYKSDRFGYGSFEKRRRDAFMNKTLKQRKTLSYEASLKDW